MNLVTFTLEDILLSRILESWGTIENLSLTKKSTFVSGRFISNEALPTASLIPIIMLRTMFQFSCPKCTAIPLLGPRILWPLWASALADTEDRFTAGCGLPGRLVGREIGSFFSYFCNNLSISSLASPWRFFRRLARSALSLLSSSRLPGDPGGD